MTISLTGFMGCGKSSVGKALATLLSCTFTDIDEYIESRTGKTIPDIFRSEGEAGFRRLEKTSLEEILKPGAFPEGREGIMVLSLGGGTVTTPECAELVKSKSCCIYLRASVETLVHNLENDFDRRPMLNSAAGPSGTGRPDREALRARIEELMSYRKGIYEKTARFIIDIDGKSPEETAGEIKNMLSGPKKTVRDPLRKKEVALTPEESVRQWCINILLHGQMKVPMHMMMSETGFRLGDKQFRADILIYDRDARPLAVVECKRPETALDRDVLEQAVRYNMVLSVKYIIITNGLKTFIFEKGQDGYRPVSHAPVYEEMLK